MTTRHDRYVVEVADLPDDAPVPVDVLRRLLGAPDAVPVERVPELACERCGASADETGFCSACGWTNKRKGETA